MSTPLRQHVANAVRRVPLLIKLGYYLYRFIQPKYTLGVVGLVFNEKREILLVEHVFHPKLPWGLPGGWVGFNEDPMLAVTRELKEELDLDVRITQIVKVERTQYHHVDMAFLCDASNVPALMTAELLGFRWFPVEQLPRMHKFHYHAIHHALELSE
jgi:ADP-ribose pyrophosphatase YjhB (NUDIX family)